MGRAGGVSGGGGNLNSCRSALACAAAASSPSCQQFSTCTSMSESALTAWCYTGNSDRSYCDIPGPQRVSQYT